jgi:hypothetical protein
MATEVVTILGTETVLPAALIVVVAIIRAPPLILISAAIVSTPVLRNSCAREERESRQYIWTGSVRISVPPRHGLICCTPPLKFPRHPSYFSEYMEWSISTSE